MFGDILWPAVRLSVFANFRKGLQPENEKLAGHFGMICSCNQHCTLCLEHWILLYRDRTDQLYHSNFRILSML